MKRTLLALACACIVSLSLAPIALAEEARSAKGFVDSVGINTHLGYSDTVYWQQWPIARDRLKELGVSHIRDGTLAANYPDVIGPTVASRYRELDAAGIKGNLLVGEEQNHGSTTVADRLAWIRNNSLAPFTIGIEGSNESWNDATFIRAMQCDIYNRVKGDTALASKPVIGPSGGPPFSGTTWYDRVYGGGESPNITPCLDKGNLHPYPGADPPNLHQDRDLSTAMEWGRILYGSKPYWATETGYWNTLADPNGVSETAAGIYVPRATLDYFRRGIEKTQLYELIDLNTASSAVIDRYGLLRTAGTRKPAFTALSNLLAIVKDSASASGSLGFGLVCKTGCHSPVRRVLLKHSSGAYYLAVWSESRVWDEGSKTNTPQPAQGIELALEKAPGKVEVFDPATGTAPISTDTSGAATINTSATDRVRLIKITPAAESPPTPLGRGGTEAELMTFAGWFGASTPVQIVSDLNSSSSKWVKFIWYGTGRKTINTTGPMSYVEVSARGRPCVNSSGASVPKMTFKLDGNTIGTKDVTNTTGWANYRFTFSAPVPAGSHRFEIDYPNHHESAACRRELHVDYLHAWAGG